MSGVTLVFIVNNNVILTNSPYNEGYFTLSTPGTWIVNYYITGTSSASPTGNVQIYSTASGIGNIAAGASTAPLQQNTASGTAGTVFAAGSFVATITTSVTYDVYINVLTGNIQMTRANCYVNSTRIG